MDADANANANVNANAYANADAGGSTIALRERCSGELQMSMKLAWNSQLGIRFVGLLGLELW